MGNKIYIVKYHDKYAKELAEIYYNTIHIINTKDYNKEQLDAWAPKSSLDPQFWMDRWRKSSPFIALIGNKPVGYAEFEESGCIDHFYVHHEFQGKGVGTALINEIEKKVKEYSFSKIYVEASITAKPFFERRGFRAIKQQIVQCNNVDFLNFAMEKHYF